MELHLRLRDKVLLAQRMSQSFNETGGDVPVGHYKKTCGLKSRRLGKKRKVDQQGKRET